MVVVAGARCAALGALLCACSSAALPVYIGADEPDEIVGATADAVDFWNDALGYWALEVRMVANAREGLRDPFAVRVVGVAYVDASSRAHADAYVVTNRVRVERHAEWVDSADTRRALAHELGHVLGLEHRCAPAQNLMCDGAEQYGERLTRAQRRRVRGLLALRSVVWPIHL